MMDDKINAERYTKGFNDGYLLSRYDRDLLKKITQHQPGDNPYFQGIASGKTAREREVFMEALQKTRAAQQDHKPKMR